MSRLNDLLRAERRRLIVAALDESDGDVYAAARILGVGISTIYYQCRKLAIPRQPRYRAGRAKREPLRVVALTRPPESASVFQGRSARASEDRVVWPRGRRGRA